MKKMISLVLSLLMVVSMFALPATVMAEEQVVDVSFRDMESSGDINGAGVRWTGDSDKYTEGTQSLRFTFDSNASTQLIFYIYRLGQGSNPADISGATMLQFDMWVPADGYFNTVNSDAGVKIDDADHVSNWGTTGGEATVQSVKNSLKDMKAGWNHVSIPLKAMTTCTNAADFRLHMLQTTVQENEYVCIDDVRFVNDLANETIVPFRNAAKEVIALLAEGNATDAETAYRALSHREREYVPEDLLIANGITPIPAGVQHTLSFDVNGGDAPIADQIVYLGDRALNVEDPTKEGFVFNGWYDDAGLVDLTNYVMPDNDVTLTAQWVKGYTLTFDWNGGESGPESQLLKAGDTPASVNDPKKEGKGFEGWYLGDTLVDFSTFVMPEEDVTVTAKWGILYFTLTFDTKGGEGDYEDQRLEIGQKPQPVPNPTREGYTF
ncbi:MAG: InlB B-repeat-containing protein, partial [Clostridia bacterium]|nr:InlB B-repeat-containing protein [Clostridia bacterium]